MTRYKIDQCSSVCSATIAVSPDGEYVRYEDAQREIDLQRKYRMEVIEERNRSMDAVDQLQKSIMGLQYAQAEVENLRAENERLQVEIEKLKDENELVMNGMRNALADYHDGIKAVLKAAKTRGEK